MGYRHIENFYRPEAQRILEFKNLFALEKVHGTSAHIGFHGVGERLYFSSGGMSGPLFQSLFNAEDLKTRFKSLGRSDTSVIVYGEAYGGKEQGMSETYGKQAQFVAFEVCIGGIWLAVPAAEKVVKTLGLRFIPYEYGPSTLEWIDAQRDADSIVAQWHGMGLGKKREGVVLRPPFEITLNNGERLIVKHKRDDFRETRTPRVVSSEALKVLEEAEAIAFEWVTEMRLEHVLQKLPEPHDMVLTPKVIKAMTEDVLREGKDEIVDSRDARRAIGAMAAKLYKERLKRKLSEK